MFYLAIALLVIGAALLVAECFIPGFGVCGISGAIAIIASAVITVIILPYGLLIVLFELLLVGALMYLAFQFIRKNQLQSKFILTETLNSEKPEIGNLDYFLGKEGMTKTPLRPFGSVDFNGVSMEASSDGAYISERKKVKVVDVSKNKLTVKLIEDEN